MESRDQKFLGRHLGDHGALRIRHRRRIICAPSRNFARKPTKACHATRKSANWDSWWGPNNTLFYLGHGPEVSIDGRPSVQSGLYLFTYDIAQKKVVNHGPILSRDKRRVFFSESIAIGADDHVYTVAWVEVTDPGRRAEIAKARAFGPAETSQMVYEMLLVKLPAWQKLLKTGK